MSDFRRPKSKTESADTNQSVTEDTKSKSHVVNYTLKTKAHSRNTTQSIIEIRFMSNSMSGFSVTKLGTNLFHDKSPSFNAFYNVDICEKSIT